MSQFTDAVAEATNHWIVTDGSASPEVVHVSAEAKTGSRYAVVVTALPTTGIKREGGRWLVSVVQPWQTSYVMADLYPLHLDYVLEKFNRPGRSVAETHGGDAVAMQMTINFAMEHFEEWTELARRQKM